MTQYFFSSGLALPLPLRGIGGGVRHSSLQDLTPVDLHQHLPDEAVALWQVLLHHLHTTQQHLCTSPQQYLNRHNCTLLMLQNSLRTLNANTKEPGKHNHSFISILSSLVK